MTEFCCACETEPVREAYLPEAPAGQLRLRGLRAAGMGSPQPQNCWPAMEGSVHPMFPCGTHGPRGLPSCARRRNRQGCDRSRPSGSEAAQPDGKTMVWAGEVPGAWGGGGEGGERAQTPRRPPRSRGHRRRSICQTGRSRFRGA